MSKFQNVKAALIKLLMSSPYNHKRDSAIDLADQIVRFLADQIRNGADLGILAGDGIDRDALIHLISLYKRGKSFN